jgi:hypothetical protein
MQLSPGGVGVSPGSNSGADRIMCGRREPLSAAQANSGTRAAHTATRPRRHTSDGRVGGHSSQSRARHRDDQVGNRLHQDSLPGWRRTPTERVLHAVSSICSLRDVSCCVTDNVASHIGAPHTSTRDRPTLCSRAAHRRRRHSIVPLSGRKRANIQRLACSDVLKWERSSLQPARLTKGFLCRDAFESCNDSFPAWPCSGGIVNTLNNVKARHLAKHRCPRPRS